MSFCFCYQIDPKCPGRAQCFVTTLLPVARALEDVRANDVCVARASDAPGSLVVTDNYLKLRIEPGRARNEWIQVRVKVTGGQLLGAVLSA